jgi:potassium efflux system protein
MRVSKLLVILRVFFCCLLGSVLAQAYAAAVPQKPASAKPRRRPQPVLPDSLAQRIERAYFVLSRVNGTARRATDTEDLSEELPAVEENLETIRQNLDQFGSVVDVKQLQMYRVLLADMQEKLGEWRTALASGSKQLTAMQARLDTLVADLPPAAARPPATTAVGRALARLQSKQDRATALLASRRQAVAGFQTRVSDGYIQALELQDVVREQQFHFGRSNSQAELPPLWHPSLIVADDHTSALVRQSYAAQRSLVSYYFRENWDYWAWMVVVAASFFVWVFRNFRALRRAAEVPATTATPGPLALPEHRLHYLRPVPVASALLVVFSLAPFLDLSAPAAYTSLLQLLLLGTVSVLGWRSWPRPLFWYWVAIMAAFFALTFAYAVRAPGLGVRWAALLLNAGAAGLGWRGVGGPTSASWPASCGPWPCCSWF